MQINMLAPGLLGEKDDFGQRYCGGVPVTVAPGVEQWLGSSNLGELNAVMKRHLMIRRLKKDVLKELPPKLHQQIFLDITAAHAVVGFVTLHGTSWVGVLCM